MITESGGSTRVYEQQPARRHGEQRLAEQRRRPVQPEHRRIRGEPGIAAERHRVRERVGRARAARRPEPQTARPILVSLDGVNWAPYLVLTFAPGDTDPQVVFVKAVDDTGREGERNATINFSS